MFDWCNFCLEIHAVTPDRLEQITTRYARLDVCVIGDVALDRYLHIDPALKEDSLETGLPVRNIVPVSYTHLTLPTN
mgnify:CR=1 FL=1